MTTTTAPYRPVEFPPVDLEIERRQDGVIVMTPRAPLTVAVSSVPKGLALTAAQLPDKTAIAERGADGAWVRKSYADLKKDADAVAQWLIDHGADATAPVLIVSDNSIAHATVRYGAMAAGAPITPVSANYALLGEKGGYERLRHVVNLIRPRFIFAETKAYAAAVAATAPEGAIVVTRDPDAFAQGAVAYADVLKSAAGPDMPMRIETLDPDAPAAYMLTSGSTGKPKAVIQTQRMITANLFQGWATLGKAAGWDDVLLEWLPWSHVSGAFSSMAAAMFGGSFYIDGGKPAPGLFDETIRNLREIPLRYFTNVPFGYAMLADALESDAALQETFFSKLRLMLYGGAGLPQPLYDRLQTLAVQSTGCRVFLTTGYGATETTSGCMSIYFDTREVGIGLPMPGLSVKMVPFEERYELRMKGPMVTKGYLRREDLETEIFDEEGFYRIGDTATFHDPAAPERGLAFAGRLAEEFKLANGTWVAGGALRAQLIKELSPHVSDALICGENRDGVGVLAWLAPQTDWAEAQDDIAVRIAAFNADNPGASVRIRRFGILTEPPNPEAHELSDKGTVNQALAKRRRAEDIERLYQDPAPQGVLSFD